MKKALALIAVLAVFGVLCTFFGCSGGGKDKPYYEEFSTALSSVEIQTVEVKKNPTAKLSFDDGSSLSIELDYYSAPNAVANFIALANKGVYEGTSFNSVVRSGTFLMLGNADNSSVKLDYYLQDEASGQTTLKRGTVCAVPAGLSDNKVSGYFFVVLKDVSFALLKQYTVIGTVTDGLEALDTIVAAPENTSGDASTGAYTVTAPAVTGVTVDTFGVKFPNPVIIPAD